MEKPKAPALIRRAESLLVRIESAVLVALLSVMVAMSFFQVVLRLFFSTGILWGDTLLRHLVLWVGFLGAALSAAEGKHFAWEAASHRPGRTGAALRLAASAAAAVIASLLMRASWLFLEEERAAGNVLFTVGTTNVPGWIFAAIIPAGFGLVLLHTMVRAAEAAGGLKG